MSNNENTQPNPEAAAAVLLPVVKIALADIVPDPKNRKGHDPEAIKDLAASMRTDGQLQPIVVRKLAPREDVTPFLDGAWGHCVVAGVVGHLEPLFTQLPDANAARAYAAVYRRGGYMIVAGERRWTAAGVLAWSEIEARVQAEGLSELRSTRQRAAENLHRENLSCIEEAEVFAQLAETGMTQPEIAAFAGKKSASTVSNSLRLLKLPAPVQALLKGGKLDRAYGVSLVRFAAWPKVCQVIAECALVDEDMTAKQFESEEVPYWRQLVDEGLAASICLSNYGDDYKLPESDPDYIEVYSNRGVCLNPAKWAEEKARQDEAKAVKEKASAARDAKTGKASGMSEKELAERRRVIEANKAKKAKTAASWLNASQAIRDCKVPEVVLASWAIEAISQGKWGHSTIRAAFERAGVRPPAGVLPGESSYGFCKPKAMQTLSARQLLGVLAGIVLDRHVDQALKNAWDVPEAVADVARFHEVTGEDDPKILAQWAKAYGNRMPVEEIARSFNAKLDDVCGALGVPVPATKPATAAKSAGQDLPLFASPAVDKVVVIGGNRAGKTATAAKRVKVAKASGAKVATSKAKAVPRGKPAAKKGRVEITSTVKDKVKALTYSGHTLAEIAKLIGISVPATFRIRKELGLVKAGKGAK